jgi:hypothetical protein
MNSTYYIRFFVSAWLIISVVCGYSQNYHASGFIENKGQIKDQFGKSNNDVLFVWQQDDFQMLFTREGFSYELKSWENGEVKFHRIDVRFQNARAMVLVEPSDYNIGVDHYYISDDAGNSIQIENVRSCNTIIYKEIYPGIDLEFITQSIGKDKKVKYNFVLQPGSSIDNIRLVYEGFDEGESAFLDTNGDLFLPTTLASIKENIPLSFERINGMQSEVSILFVKNDDGSIGFRNPDGCSIFEHEFVIDPSPTIGWSTYFGGVQIDIGWTTKLDGAGSVYVGGQTASTTLVATAGAHQGVFASAGGTYDGFIVKFDLNGVRLWGTYFGGSADDQISGMYCDGGANVYITGSTASNGMATVGSFQGARNGSSDVLLAKFNATGVRQWSTYFGGAGTDAAYEIVGDAGGNVYFGGQTGSSDVIGIVGSFLAVAPGATDGFFAKFSSAGSRIWSSFFGGTSFDSVEGICLDALGNLYITGNSVSAAGISTVGSHQPSLSGGSDAFLAKFTSAGAIIWGTYFGSTSTELAKSVSADVLGNVIIGGNTASNSGLITPGQYQIVFGGGTSDGFLAQFNSAGTMSWCTYFGGSANDYISNVICDACNNIYFCGYTASTNGIAGAGASQALYGGGSFDGFMGSLNSTGAYQWSTYFGGTASDQCQWIDANVITGAYATGSTQSTSAIATAGAYQTVQSSSAYSDAFLVKLVNIALLPVELLYFEAKEINESGKVECSWATVSETENDYFGLERSMDGKNWKEIAQINGSGTTQTYNEYKWIDENPLIGGCYYRLIQVDFNGQRTEGIIDYVKVNLSIDDIILYPVPAKDKLRAVVPIGSKYISWSIVNSEGKRIMLWNEVNEKENDGIIEIDISSLPAGLYTIQIVNSSFKNSTKSFIRE